VSVWLAPFGGLSFLCLSYLVQFINLAGLFIKGSEFISWFSSTTGCC